MLVQQPWLQIGSLALYRPTPHLLRQIPWLRVFVQGVVIVGEPFQGVADAVTHRVRLKVIG